MSRNMNDFKLHQAAKARGTSWHDTWKDTQGGFNPDVFKDLDDDTRQKLADYQIGPPVLGSDKMGIGQLFSVGHWSEGGDYGAPLPYGMNALVNASTVGEQGTNRGSVQNAVWEMGLANIGNKEQLKQFLDRTDALTAKHGNFLNDGWDPEDIMLYREKFEEPVPAAEPDVTTPVEPAVEVPEVVEQAPAPREPIEGVDYMTEGMQNIYDDMRNYNTGFKSEDWIAETSKPDTDQQDYAQNFADKWKFEIAENLQPDPQSVVNALTTAIPGKLGIYS